jgi:hypothetical protein
MGTFLSPRRRHWDYEPQQIEDEDEDEIKRLNRTGRDGKKMVAKK